jgi:hypothetical protein
MRVERIMIVSRYSRLPDTRARQPLSFILGPDRSSARQKGLGFADFHSVGIGVLSQLR